MAELRSQISILRCNRNRFLQSRQSVVVTFSLERNLHPQLQRAKIVGRAGCRAIEFCQSFIVLAQLGKLGGEFHPGIRVIRPALQIGRQFGRRFVNLFLRKQSLGQSEMNLPQRSARGM